MTERVSDARDLERAVQLWGEMNVIDREEPKCQTWMDENNVRYVLPWTLGDQAALVTMIQEFLGRVRAEERATAFEDGVRAGIADLEVSRPNGWGLAAIAARAKQISNRVIERERAAGTKGADRK